MIFVQACCTCRAMSGCWCITVNPLLGQVTDLVVLPFVLLHCRQAQHVMYGLNDDEDIVPLEDDCYDEGMAPTSKWCCAVLAPRDLCSASVPAHGPSSIVVAAELTTSRCALSHRPPSLSLTVDIPRAVRLQATPMELGPHLSTMGCLAFLASLHLERRGAQGADHPWHPLSLLPASREYNIQGELG
jgi:hypothetical protein